MITTINEWKKINEGAMNHYLIGKQLDLYGKGVLTILSIGPRIELYNKFNVSIPANPMGYHIPEGRYMAVRDERNEIKILQPGALQKALDMFNKSKLNNDSQNTYKLVADLSTLQIDDVIYYKVSNDQYIKGFVGDDFGDGKFLIFSSPILIGGDREKQFELYKGEYPEIESKLYTL